MDLNNDAQLGVDEPLNELERSLFACMNGELAREEFLNHFIRANLFIMVDGEPIGDTLGYKTPLVFANGADQPKLMAVFSDPSRAQKMVEKFSEYNFPIQVTTVWVLDTIGSHMGIAFNPGCHFGFEIAPEGAQQLKHAVDEARAQAQQS